MHHPRTRITGASDNVFATEVLPFDHDACDGHVWVEASLTYENSVTGED